MCRQVTGHKVSSTTRSGFGRNRRDAFLKVMKTCENSVSRSVATSETGLAFCSDWDFTVGQRLLLLDGEDVVEVVVRHTTKDGDRAVYGVEATLASPLPARFASQTLESSLRLDEEMNLLKVKTNSQSG